MSVSEGLQKNNRKNYCVKLVRLGNTAEVLKKESLTKLKIQPWTHVLEIKSKIAKEFGISNRNIRLFYCNIEMMDDLTMLDYKVIDAKKPEIGYRISSNPSEHFIQVYGAFQCPSVLNQMIEEITHGFLQGLVPTLIVDGTSGTYVMRNTSKETVALFKPLDEEAFAPNNQKGYVGKFGQESFRKGVLSGEGSIREVAAYILDPHNTFGVPETTFVEVSHPAFNKNNNELLQIDDLSISKFRNSIIHNFLFENIVHATSAALTLNSNSNSTSMSSILEPEDGRYKKYNYIRKKYGSLQRFVKSTDIAANFSSSLYCTSEVHKIAILDIRILNCDRNDENILVIKKKDKKTGKSTYTLVPIDHSLSLPDCVKIQDYEICWMGWDQVKKPFSKKMMDYIARIDIVGDMNRLSKSIKLREKCWKFFRVSNTVLKIGAELGLNLYEIGCIMYRPDFDDSPSIVEQLIEKTDKICEYINFDKENKLFKSMFAETIEQTNDDNDSEIIYTNENNNQCTSQAILYNEESADEGDIIAENIIITLNPSVVHPPKKPSLLKRTASEPKLSCMTEQSDVESAIHTDKEKEKLLLVGNAIDSNDTIGQSEHTQTEITPIITSNYTWKCTALKKEKNKAALNSNLMDDSIYCFDSPLEEMYFHHFEMLLVDYINKIKSQK